MKCKGEFINRGMERREGGNLITDKGQTISYKPAYKIKVDELTEEGVFERILKIEEDKAQLINDFRVLDIYQKINITFNVVIYNTRVVLVPEVIELV